MKEYFAPELNLFRFAKDVVLDSTGDPEDNNGSYNDWEDGPFGTR